MTAASLRIVDFDEFELDPITTGICEGNFLIDFDIASQFTLETVKAATAGDFPTLVRGDPMDKVIPLHIIVRQAATAGGTLDRINAMKEAFSPFRDPGYLRVVDENGNIRRMLCKSLGVVPWEEHSSQAYVASLDADEPIWEADSEIQSQEFMSGTVAAAGWTFPIDNTGNVRSYPDIISVRAWSHKGNANDFIRRWRPHIAWRSPLAGVDTQGLPYPIDIFDGQFDTAAEVGAGRMRTGCDDIAVFLDGVQVDRYVERPNTTGTAVWCSMAFQPARSATVPAMGNGANPATGEDLQVTNPEGTVGFPDTGVLLIDSEAVLYRGREADRFLNVTRAFGYTATAAHGAGTTAWFEEHEIIVLTNYSAYADPREDADRKPMLDLAASTNALHSYGSEGFYTDALRTGQWLRELRGTQIGAAVMAMSQAGGELIIADSTPSADAPNFDALSLYAPCFVSPLITGTSFDYQVDHAMLLELYAVDTEGHEVLLQQRDVRGETNGLYWIGPPPFENAHEYRPGDPLSRLTFHARNWRITGKVDQGLVSLRQVFPVSDSNNQLGESFRLRAEGQIRGFHFKACAAPGTTRQFTCRPAAFVGGVPETIVLEQVSVPGSALPTGTTAPFCDDISVFTGYILPYDEGDVAADTYAEKFDENPVGAGTIYILATGFARPVYSGGSYWQEVATVWSEIPAIDLLMTMLGENATQQPDAEFNSGREVRLRNVNVHLHEDYIPHFIVPAAGHEAYWWQATLENVTTGQVLTLNDAGARINVNALSIYPQNRAVAGRDAAAFPAFSRPGAVEPDDLQDWFYLQPGVNIIRYTEPSIGNALVSAAVAWRPRWT